MSDQINPAHYTRLHPEPIDVIEAWGLHRNYYRATALKYIARAGRKDDELADLGKAVWYLQREIAALKRAVKDDLAK